MLLTVTMGTKKQFKMYLEEDLFDRLKGAADKLGKSSGQEVAEEILSIYFPVWLNINDSMNRAVQYQTNVVAEELTSRNKKQNKSDFIYVEDKGPLDDEMNPKKKKVA